MTAAAVAFGGGTLAATMAGTSSAAVLATTTQQDQAAAGAAGSGDYVVLYERGASKAAAKRAIERAGGRITSANGKVGFAMVKANDSKFAERVAASDAIVGAARNRIIGRAPQPLRPDGVTMKDDVERLSSERAALKGSGGRGDAKSAQEPLAEPLANLQWDMRQIGATPQGSYAESQGKRRVKVGIIDTGVDGHHPDIAPNFSRRLSANFTVDIPFVDGECEEADCVDPPDVDDNGHGTHVASTVGSPINGLGMAGVAPKVKLINIRAGQDSGYFFLAPTLLALTYAGDIGVDVVNMSYYVDPWLFNCVDNPADSPAERTEQRVIRQTVQRAVSYAMNHGVMPIAAEGNGATDLGNPEIDATSPDFPPGEERVREIDNSCIVVPTETRGVLSVASTGFSHRKAYYSNYGREQTAVSAPGGDYYDTPTNTGNPENLVLAAYPEELARENGEIDPDGTPNTPFVVRDCADGTCAYYQYLQGTSMASPHAAGVAALIVSQLGQKGDNGWTLKASATKRWLKQTAVPHACPQPRLYEYTRILSDGSVVESEAYCEGSLKFNGFYGHGIVNAYNAARLER